MAARNEGPAQLLCLPEYLLRSTGEIKVDKGSSAGLGNDGERGPSSTWHVSSHDMLACSLCSQAAAVIWSRLTMQLLTVASVLLEAWGEVGIRNPRSAAMPGWIHGIDQAGRRDTPRSTCPPVSVQR